MHALALVVVVVRLASPSSFAAHNRGSHKGLEERMRVVRLALELGVKLTPNKMRVVGEFYYFNQSIVGARATQYEPGALQWLAKVIVELEAMAVSLADFFFAVDLLRAAAGHQLAGIGAETHSSAFRLDAALIRHQVDDGVFRASAEFHRVRSLEPADTARVFNYSQLHTQADSKEWDPLFTRITNGRDFSFNATIPEPTRHQDSVEVFQM